MGKATEELIKTHRLVEKLLEQFEPEKPRFAEVRKTLERAVLAHTWLQNELLLPVLKGKPLIERRFLEEIGEEHRDLEHRLKLLLNISPEAKEEVQALVIQIRAILEAHFYKEALGLYPLAEKVVEASTLVRLGTDMERRKNEVRDLAQV